MNSNLIMPLNPIYIYQKNWAFISSTSEKPQIQTGSFGPCYVVTFTSGKFAAMAHIDDTTIVESMTSIFDKFIENSINLSDVKVIVLGGWLETPVSAEWGGKIVAKIYEAGFKHVSTKNMHSKRALTIEQERYGFPKRDESKYYYLGAMVDSSSGKTFILPELLPSLAEEQRKQTDEFAKKYFSGLVTEVPLTQVVE